MDTEFLFDVFISYSSKDCVLVRVVAESLRQAQLRVWFDEWEIQPGDHILMKIEEGLEQSRRMVLCMSENAFSSDWSFLESSSLRFRDPLNRERKLIPIRLDGTPIKGSLNQLKHIDWSTGDNAAHIQLVKACRAAGRTTNPIEANFNIQNIKDEAKKLDYSCVTDNKFQFSTQAKRQKIAPINRIGTKVGAYRITAALGRGVGGTIYLGGRADRQYSVQVAITILEDAAHYEVVSQRLRVERQFLAHINHPFIARLIDIGETPSYEPFFVSEYVDGKTLHEHCDDLKLSLKQRLHLFLKICEAVEYGHKNLIVHRDIKPDTIRVTQDGTPKLLDFGIARLLDLHGAEHSMGLMRSEYGIFTAEFASPELILGQTVTTASDIYSLGIVLFELLTGFRPYAVSHASQLELERSICVTDPPRPSEIVRHSTDTERARSEQSDATIEDIARNRGSSPKTLASTLSGDVDAIIMRAIKKEPERRYRSVEQLSEDIRRYLNLDPVSARQGNWLYYTNRFIRRHFIGVALTTLTMLYLLALAVFGPLTR